ncbi:MAG: CARDB domain-containing protein [Opitutaceae bacterium]
MNRLTTLLTLCLGSLALFVTGCQTQVPTRTADRGYTAPVSKPASTQWRGTETSAPAEFEAKRTNTSKPAQVIKSKDVILKTNQIEVTKTILQPASVGGNLKYRVAIKALDDVSTVRVSESIPSGVQFISSSPSTSLSGGSANWTFPSMRKGQTQNIDITVKPVSEGDHQMCSTVSVDNAFCLDVFSGQPKLEVIKKGPASIELGEEASWTVTVNNNGSAAANNVIVTDNLPDAFEATSKLSQNVGTLEPGETKSVTYSAKAVKQGNFTNRAVANYDGGTGTSPAASSPIKVVQSGIRVRKTGPTEAYVFKPVPFDITIENTGDTDLKNVRITDILPKGASVSDNGKGRVSGNAIGWMIPNLPAGASQLIRTEVASTRKGSSTNKVKVISDNGLEASDEVTTNWLAVPGVTVSITDSKDPIRVREQSTYSIQVKNQGDFEPVSGTVTVTFNNSIKPISVAGDAQGTINGQTVTFPRTTLEPGKDTNLTITVEGGNIGPGRAVMEFSADFLNDPIISQETTNVY